MVSTLTNMVAVSNEQTNGPVVSVVMPVCNMEAFLAESIESILGQTFPDFELIILDFGSTDQSRVITSAYAARDARIQVHDVGTRRLVEVRNLGACLARGRYIAVQDADDVSLPDRLALEVDLMRSHREIGLVGGCFEWVDSNGKPMQVSNVPTDDQDIQSALQTHSPFCHSTVLVRKDAFDLVGGYRAVMTQSHDYDLALRISEHYRCANLSQVVLKYRVHPYQVSLSRRRGQSMCALAAQASAAARRAGKPDPLDHVMEITPEILIALGISEARLQRELASEYRKWIHSTIRSGDPGSASKLAQEVLRSRWDCLDRPEAGELYFVVAKFFWKEGNVTSSLIAVFRMLLVCPQMVRRLVKPLGRRLGLAS